MSKQTEAIKLALEALLWANNEINEWRNESCGYKPEDQPVIMSAITALQEAWAEQTAQPQQEPVAVALNTGTKQGVKFLRNVEHGKNLYTSPPQRKPLTDEEIQEVVTKAVRERKLSWLGFKKDDQGEYTIPVLSPSDYQMARSIKADHDIGFKP